MSAYVAIESIVVAVLALASLFYVLKAFIPGPLNNIRMHAAGWLSRTAHRGSRLNLLATRMRVDGASGGCASGCESGCNGCGIAARARPQSARDESA